MKFERKQHPSEAAREKKRSAVARWILLALSAACAVVVTLSASHVRAQNAPVSDRYAKVAMPYDEAADPHRDLQNALADARKSGKRVLIVFGTNSAVLPPA